MTKLVSMFLALEPARRIVVLLATVGTIAAVLTLARVANTPSMALLYSGLEPAAAGEVLQALDQAGAAYEVRGSAIYVDQAQRDALRLALAAEGKPNSTTAGYEILENLSGFGTTSQMFDAAYWRAKEGELARTIIASPVILSARVHISKSPARSFGVTPPDAASVVVTTRDGRLSAGQAKALKYLVASAVSGLAPDQVSVIDADGGLIASGDEADFAASGDRAAVLKANVERLLEARVGYGNSVVEVNVETVNEREQILERRFDPESRVAISTVTEESSTSAQDARSGSVTVASNLADGDAEGGGGNSTSEEAGIREQINYEVSETQREVVRAPGSIRRLTVAVLVDGLRETADDGSVTWQPRPDEELEALRTLVASAVGFDESRGDVISLQSMEFLPTETAGTVASAPASFLQGLPIDPMRIIQLGVLSAVALILGLFVVRPILMAAPPEAVAALAPPPPEDPPAISEAPVEDLPVEEPMQIMTADPPETTIPELPAPTANAGLTEVVGNRSEDLAAVLQDWLEEKAEKA